MQQIALPQSNAFPIAFMGERIASAEGRPVESKQGQSQHVLELYEAEDDRWLVSISYETTYNDDAERRAVLVGDNPSQLVSQLESYDAGADKTGWPQGAQFERKRQYITSLLRRNYRAALDVLLTHLPSSGVSLPPRRWRCDACGGPIQTVEDGWVEWRVPVDGGPGHGLRIVHHRSANAGCHYHDDDSGAVVADDHLRQYVGPDGLMQLLGMMDGAQLPPSEVIEVIRRLHVPLYEAARPYLKSAEDDGLVDLEMAPGCYSQAQLLAILKRYESESTARD